MVLVASCHYNNNGMKNNNNNNKKEHTNKNQEQCDMHYIEK